MITADVYGAGAADRLLGRALAGVDRDSFCVVGAVGHDFVAGERDGPRGYPRFTDADLRGPDEYADYLRAATEASLERVGISAFDLLLLHNPDRTGFSSEAVWDGMAALVDAGLTDAIGVAPGPANGFTLDLIDCFERFGDRIDWAMVILNPLEPWPGELCLAAAEAHDVRLITRVVDYGGLFWDDVRADDAFAEHDHRRFRPDGWVEAGRERLERMRPIAGRRRADADAARLPVEPRPRAGRVRRPDPDPGGGRRRPGRSRTSAPSSPPCREQRLGAEEFAEIRRIGDNRGSMTLKGASPEHEGDERPDRWPLSDEPDRGRPPLGRRPGPRPAPHRPRLNPLERFAAWILTGPVGRVVAFFADLAVYWWRWVRRREADRGTR